MRQIHQAVKRGKDTEDHGLIGNLKCILDHVTDVPDPAESPAQGESEGWKQIADSLSEKPCERVYCGYPIGTTCLDVKARAIAAPELYSDEYRNEILIEKHLCFRCRIRQWANITPPHNAESQTLVEALRTSRDYYESTHDCKTDSYEQGFRDGMEHTEEFVSEALRHHRESEPSPSAGGWVSVPPEATAENGLKALLIGDFHETVTVLNEDGEPCEQRVPIEWTNIKAIYRRAVAHFAPTPSTEAQSPQPAGSEGGVRAALRDLLGQVERFCATEGEANFETRRAREALNLPVPTAQEGGG